MRVLHSGNNGLAGPSDKWSFTGLSDNTMERVASWTIIFLPSPRLGGIPEIFIGFDGSFGKQFGRKSIFSTFANHFIFENEDLIVTKEH